MSGPPFTGAAHERLADVGRGVTLCFERIGDPGATPLLLVAGLGQQLHAWPTALCTELAEAGFTVYRFDNRDAGRSTHHPDQPPPGLWAMLTGRHGRDGYRLPDMARDTVGLIDALELGSVHLAGMSMGGMIAQTVAAHAPERVRSLSSLISTTGARDAGRLAWSTWPRMFAPPPGDRSAAGRAAVAFYRHIGAHGFDLDEDWIRAEAEASWDRDPGPSAAAGTGRQLAAILGSGDRTAELARIDVPTLVVHGDRDRMVHPSGGEATRRAIPGARAVTVAGMGHDLPHETWPRLVAEIRAVADEGERRRAAPAVPDPIPPARPVERTQQEVR
ncbi:alpha/beta fold hydrolase [Pseudonocardia alni]|uniref:alpha/beta fold hydrolase n=1 Tax=Pseudonocardia alni TaxID=33907 RepID=UPI0033EF4858